MNDPHHPPAWGDRILESFCAPHLLEEVQGDLHELYGKWVEEYGVRKARWLYIFHTIKFFRPYSIKRLTVNNPTDMFKNYFIIAIRNLLRQKLYAFINVFGLAVGFAFCVLIFLYVHDELTFDRFHERGDRIYRVLRIATTPDGNRHDNPWLPMPLGPALAADLPEVKAYVRFNRKRHFVRVDDHVFEEDIVYADSNFFQVFSFPLLKGNPITALSDPNSIVLSEDAAHRYFGNEEPIGKRLAVQQADHFLDFIVTGVAKDVPSNSSIQFDFLLPFSKLGDVHPAYRTAGWDWVAFLTYVLLEENATQASIEEKLPEFYAKYYPATVNMPVEEKGGYLLQALQDIHLDPGIAAGLTATSDPRYSYILSAVALAVLLLACINFATLSIGQAARRTKELGIRKAVGALRSQLAVQFWGEALLVSALALAIGLLLVQLFLPTFNNLAVKQLSFTSISVGLTVGALIVLTLATGLMAGSYPALVLSRFRPIEVLRSTVRLGGSNTFTQSLVIVQFTVSAILVISMFVMLRQLDYIRSKNLGFDAEQVIVIPTTGLEGNRMVELYRNRLNELTDVVGITGTSKPVGMGTDSQGFPNITVYQYRVDPNYLNVLGIEIVAGRNFDPNLATDPTHSILVNEALVRAMGWEEPLGKSLDLYMRFAEDHTEMQVIGVVKDHHFQSLHAPISPMMLTLDPGRNIEALLVRSRADQAQATLDQLGTIWQEVAPDIPFKYSFLDDDINRQYQIQERWKQIVIYAAAFAILVACLGLFGTAFLTVTGRTREIGIRKVLGATVGEVVGLLSKDFIKLVLIAVVIASPIAWYAMNRWLQDFAYRIELQWWLFVLAGGMTLLIAILTVSFQSIKAAIANPVDSLRNE